MRHAHNRRFGYAFVQHERAFDFCRSHAVPGNIDDIVDATSDPVIAITVPPRSITGGIFSPEHREIGLKKTIMIAIDRSEESSVGKECVISCRSSLSPLP